MRISDWKSDVCSADLSASASTQAAPMPREPPNTNAIFLLITLPLSLSAYRDGHDTLFGHFTNGVARPLAPETAVLGAPVGHEVDTGARGLDRKSVVEGKSVSVSVDLGGCGALKKKK